MQSFTEWEQELKDWQKNSKTTIIGKKSIFFAEIGSTNKFLKENDQLKHGSLVLAQQQSQGKGQNDRVWISNAGGLYMSVKLEIRSFQQFQPFWLTATFTLGLCNALTQLGLKPTIKWPNDILINNKKVAGVLTETIMTQTSLTAVIGLGVNVNNSLEEIFKTFPGLSTQITSVMLEKDSKKPIPFKDILEPTLTFVESKIRNLHIPLQKTIKSDWLNLCQIENQSVEIQNLNSHELITGLVIKVTDSGSLLIKLADGKIEEFTAGEIKLKREIN